MAWSEEYSHTIVNIFSLLRYPIRAILILSQYSSNLNTDLIKKVYQRYNLKLVSLYIQCLNLPRTKRLHIFSLEESLVQYSVELQISLVYNYYM